MPVVKNEATKATKIMVIEGATNHIKTQVMQLTNRASKRAISLGLSI